MQPSAARTLWIGLSILATYVSIYPGDFQTPAFLSEAFADFFGTCCGRPGRGDVLGNVVLFVPFGFLGMLAAPRGGELVARGLFVCIVAALFALALQVAQVYLPTRDENLQDVLWNLLGTLAGIPFGVMLRQLTQGTARLAAPLTAAPLVLIGAWLCYRLVPFVPSVDFQAIKDSLKPLLLRPQLSVEGVLHDAVAWLLVAAFARMAHSSLRLDRYVPVLIVVTLALEVLIVSNTVSASNVIGAAVAAGLWLGVLQRLPQRDPILLGSLLVMLLVSGLAPFELRGYPAPFAWLPFQGFLRGSMYINAQSACEKFFLYGALVFMLWRVGFRRVTGTVIAAAVVVVIEIAQTRFDGHTPELTDPILVVIAALVLAAFGDSARADLHRPAAHGLRRPPVSRRRF